MLFFTDCNNKKLNTIGDFDIESLVGKWKMVEYAGGSVNALDTITFYENGKMDYPFETGEFTYRFMLIIGVGIPNADYIAIGTRTIADLENCPHKRE